jgi:two-component system, OmpR family, response regulator PhoP
MAKILIIEDSIDLAKSLTKGLEIKNHTIRCVFDGLEGRVIDWNEFDLVIVDWNLPKMNGLDLIHQKRNLGWNGICMMLTARSETLDKVAGLDFGADDYISKPFHWDELYSRINALLRRKYGISKNHVGSIDWDRNSKQFSEHDSIVPFTKTEYSLMVQFMLQPQRIFSRSELEEYVYKDSSFPDSNSIERHIAQIRKKCKYDPIETLRSRGYRLRFNPTNT